MMRAIREEELGSSEPELSKGRTQRSPRSRQQNASGPAAGGERRRHPRGAFQREVVVLEDRSEQVRQVLVGRDLSAGGMGVEPHPSLALGDSLRLAIFDPSFRVPFTVKAEVVRDDRQRGLGLRFTHPEAETSQRIGHLVSTLLASGDFAPATPPF